MLALKDVFPNTHLLIRGGERVPARLATFTPEVNNLRHKSDETS